MLDTGVTPEFVPVLDFRTWASLESLDSRDIWKLSVRCCDASKTRYYLAAPMVLLVVKADAGRIIYGALVALTVLFVTAEIPYETVNGFEVSSIMKNFKND